MPPLCGVCFAIGMDHQATYDKTRIEELETKIKSLATTPDLSGAHRSADGTVEGSWEEGDESATIVSGYEGRGPRAERPQGFRARMDQ